MLIHCPHCKFPIALKGVRPGRFTPACSKCKRRFALVIPDEANADPWVSVLGAGDGYVPPAGGSASAEGQAPAQASGSGESGNKPASNPPPSANQTLAPTQIAPPTQPPAASAHATSVPEAAPAPAVAAAAVAPGSSSAANNPTLPPTRAAEASAAGASPAPFLASVAVAAHEEREAEADAARGNRKNDADSAAAAGGTARPAPHSGLRADEGKNGDMPSQLGGYRILSKLGQGGMGAVYRARQLSLDRDVAVKVMNPQWSQDPAFVARFTREAYAAAQLVHHHVVQIHDIGLEKKLHFFSMEFVRGKSLADLLDREGRLDPELAVGYILQAARGLKFAHDMGMVHRDIKPENLLLSDQGIVKVADLGLVKTPGLKESGAVPQSQKLVEAASAHQTMANASMGTPAYMAPEQAQDAAHVDHRADIYSLGCTLYHMITGRPPFTGKTAVEVISKHQTEAVTPPEVIVRRVPKILSSILMKMVAKDPAQRYQSMAEVIKALEEYLGMDSAGPFSPREEHANLLEECVSQFNNAPRAKQRKLAILGFYAVCLFAVVVLSMARQPMWAGGFVGLAVLATISHITIAGITQKTVLFAKLRSLIFGAGFGDWLMGIIGLALAVAVLHVVGWLWVWLGFAVVGVALAGALHMTLDKLVVSDRREPIRLVEEMLRTMRLRALDEDSLRQFVSRYSGNVWEEFYEALFGYEEKLVARQRWGRGEQGRMRKKFGAWRDPLIAWIDAKLKDRQDEREKRVLKKLERAKLKAEGMSNKDAERRAEQAAELMVDRAVEVRLAAMQRASQTIAPTSTEAPAVASSKSAAAPPPAKPVMNVQQMTDFDTAAASREASRKAFGKRRGGPIDWLMGPRTRFVVGALLLTACLMWVKQNDLVKWDAIKAWANQTVETARSVHSVKDVSQLGKSVVKGAEGTIDSKKHIEPVKIPGVPEPIRTSLSGFSTGIAGLVLIASAWFPGCLIGLFVLPAAALVILGPSAGVPDIGPLSASALCNGGAMVLTILGWLVRKRG